MWQGFRSLLLISYFKDIFSMGKRRIADSINKFRWWAAKQFMLFTWVKKSNAILSSHSLKKQRDLPFNREWSLFQYLINKSFGSQSKLKQMHLNRLLELSVWRWEKPFQKLTKRCQNSSQWLWPKEIHNLQQTAAFNDSLLSNPVEAPFAGQSATLRWIELLPRSPTTVSIFSWMTSV